jgi:hypothetical protein
MADCHEQKTGLEPSQQPVEELVPHAGNEVLFELIPDGVPVLKDSEVKHKLLQWYDMVRSLYDNFFIKSKRFEAHTLSPQYAM